VRIFPPGLENPGEWIVRGDSDYLAVDISRSDAAKLSFAGGKEFTK
jgi:hypothetical protein